MRSSASHRLQIDNGELFARVEGAGYPVLFLHGWTLDSEMWASTFHDLPRHYRLIATDRRGHGQSTLPADFSKETGDLELWLDHLHEEKVALVGMSQGGRLALRFASQNPDRVSALVLYGTSADGIVPPQGDDRIPLGYYTDLVQRGDLVAMQEAWLSHPLMHCDDQEVKVACAKMVRRYRAEDLQRGIAKISTTRCGHSGDLKMPVLIVTGSQEGPGIQFVADRLAQKILGSRRSYLEGAGHLAPMTHPSAFNRMIDDFLQAAIESP
ncbi:MAG: alpha/beta hydrolase [Beijerinckiaceae bacterium]|jgi:pimeloyl-ACP methyl ester carboxylesterase